jgi:cytochrome c oxidase subunit 2
MKTEQLVGHGWFPAAATDAASGPDSLFYFILIGSIIIFAGILYALIHFLIKYKRKSPNQLASGQLVHQPLLEISWTVIPFILVTIVFFWGYKDFLKMSIPPVDSMEVRVTGKKWLWQIDYPRYGVKTVGELVVPVNQPVKLVMSSEDVIHSFFIPNMRVKRDVIPNRYTRLWFEANRTGTFQVFCTEYCGDGHSQMLATLRVVSQEEFKDWLKAGSSGGDLPLPELGAKVYTKYACNTCHSLDGATSVGPTWKGLYGSNRPLTSGSAKADDNYLRESIVNPKAKIVAGYAPVMPAFAGLLSDREIDGVIEFIKAQK